MTSNSVTVPQRYYLGAIAVVAVTIAATLIAYPSLPTVVPLHLNGSGDVHSWGPKWSLFLYTPALMIAIVLMFVTLPWLTRKHFGINSLRPAHLCIMIVILALLSYSQLLIVTSGLGINVAVNRAIVGGLCLLAALFSSLTGTVRRLLLSPTK